MISVLGTDFFGNDIKIKSRIFRTEILVIFPRKLSHLDSCNKNLLQLLDRHVANVTLTFHKIGDATSTLHEIGDVTSTSHEIGDVTLTLHEIADVSHIDC